MLDRLLTWLLLGLATLVVAMDSAGQLGGSGMPESGQTPGLATRLIGAFDFEETDETGIPLGRAHTMPRYWFIIGRPADVADPNFLGQALHQELLARDGYPSFTEVGYASNIVTSGQYSLRLALDSGNAGAFLQAGALSAIPESEYLVQTRVRTEALTHARARFEAYFVDGQGYEIADSRRTIDGIETHGQWDTVALQLPSAPPEAAWIGMEVHLRQPTPTELHPLGAQQVVLNDVWGEVWFDDIVVWQLPTVSLRSNSDTNVIRAPREPELEMSVRDLSGQQLMAYTRVYDISGRLVDELSRTMGGGSPTSWNWSPQLNRYGWYRVELSVFEAVSGFSTLVDTVTSSLLYLPEVQSNELDDAQRFYLLAEGLPADELDVIAEMVRGLGVYGVVLSAWDRQTHDQAIERRLDRLDALVQPLLNEQRRVVFSLWPLPAALSSRYDVESEDPLAVMQHSAETWGAYLSPLMRIYGAQVKDWMLGPAGEATAFYAGEVLPETLGGIRQELLNLSPDPTLVVPWRLDQAPPEAEDGAGVSYWVRVPEEVAPESLSAYLTPWASHRYRLWLEPPDAHDVSGPSRVADYTLRMLEAWRAQPESIAIGPEWERTRQRGMVIAPDPVLGVYAGVVPRLVGRRVWGELQLGEGLRCLILGGESGGALVVWNESAPASEATVRMHLGEQVERVDVWGNRSAIPADDENKHTLVLEETPVFIEGIDAQLAMFRAGFAIKPNFIPAAQTQHRRTITLVNPWPFTINGNLTIRGPEGWRVSPARHQFAISAGQTVELPVDLFVPVSEVAGAKLLLAEAEFQADRRFEIDLATPMDLGLEHLEVDATLSLEPNAQGGDPNALVTSIITNTGTEPISLYAYAALYGYPRQEQLVPDLQPGESVIRRFRFTNAAPILETHAVRTGARESNGPAMLNLRLTLGDTP